MYSNQMPMMNIQTNMGYPMMVNNCFIPLLDENQFEKLVSKVNSISWDDEKYNAVSKFLPGKLITSNQAHEIIKLFSFDKDQIKVAKLLCTYLYDRENLDEMLSAFSFDSSKREVEKHMESLGPQTPQIMPQNQGMFPNNFNYVGQVYPNPYQINVLSQEDMDKWIDKIEKEFQEREKLKKLNTLAQSKFFTASQAKEFVKLFSFNDDQKKACLVLYPRLVDKENYDEMLDALSFSLSKDDVEKQLGLK